VRRVRTVRALRWLALTALSLAVFEACTSSGTDTPLPPPGPPIVALQTPASTLSCDNFLVVTLDLTYFTLRPPYYCGTTPQCGTVLVSLLGSEPDGGTGTGSDTDDLPVLASAYAATASVQLDLSALVNPTTPSGHTLSDVRWVKAELYGDSLKPIVVPAGGKGSDALPLSLTPATGCSGAAGAGAGGAAGAGTVTPSDAGAVGTEAGAGGVTSNGGSSGGGGATGSAGATSSGGSSSGGSSSGGSSSGGSSSGGSSSGGSSGEEAGLGGATL
jgi:hypothetical protein